MQFPDVAIASQAANTIRETDIEILDADHIDECPLWIRGRNNPIGFDRFAVFEAYPFDHEAVGAAVNQYSVNRCAIPDFGARFAGRCA